jgi:outer membrane protein assembly factor BamB
MNEKQRALCYQAAQATVIAAVAFLLLAGGLLLFNQRQGKISGFLKSKEFVRLQQELKKRPKDQQLKEQIRAYDQEIRQNAFYQLELSANTTQAMVWGVVVLLASAHLVRVFRKQPPNPLAWGPRESSEERQINRVARYAVAVVFGFVLAIGVAVAMRPVELPAKKIETVTVPVEQPPTADELAANWISFRGPAGQNFSPNESLPATWSVAWKTEVPLPGLSSPVRWNNALFLTGANKEENRVFRFDLETGSLVWSATVKIPNAPKPGQAEVNEGTGHAAPSCVTDGRRVYALFANGDVAAFNFEGKQIWAKNLGLPANSYGLSASLALHQDKVIVQLDLGSEEDGKSKVLALNSRTGQEVWSVKRPVGGSWSSPVIAEVDGQPQLILAGNPLVVAYNPADGAELWKASVLHGDVAPSPVVAGGLVIVISPGKDVQALEKGAVKWTNKDGAPDTSSPATDGALLYFMNGTALTCVDVVTGKAKWTEDLGEEAYATPMVAGNGVLVVLRGGGVRVAARGGDKYTELLKADLGEKCDASPIIHDGKVIIRGEKHLFGIQSGAGGVTASGSSK